MPSRPPTFRPARPALPDLRPRRPHGHTRLYDRRWQGASKAFLAEHPRCAACGGAATEVDHKTPHKGDGRLFWDKANWQALCESCHSRKTAAEDGGFGRRPAASP